MAVKYSTEELEIAGQKFAFQLCSKSTQFVEMEFEQWWMPHASIYQDRQRDAKNFQSLIDFWWTDCREHGTDTERSVQQMYVLARLLPFARSNGSRKVFIDSVPRRRMEQTDRSNEAIVDLEEMLRKSRGKQLDEVGFRDQTANAIGPPILSESTCQLYGQMEADLFEKAHVAFGKDGQEGLEIALTQWQQWRTSIGRRAGNKDEKAILDILSYEARTALHQCYAHVWAHLIPHLAKSRGLSSEAQAFHALWHGLHCCEAAGTDEARFDLFHGHIFALHPGVANLILTHRGRELIEAWVLNPGSKVKCNELLYGLAIAIHDYAIRHDVYAELRKQQPDALTEGMIDTS